MPFATIPLVAGDPCGAGRTPLRRRLAGTARRPALAQRVQRLRIDNGEQRPADGAAENRYTRAAADVADWIARRALVRDPEARLYVYDQEFELHRSNAQVLPAPQDERRRSACRTPARSSDGCGPRSWIRYIVSA